MDTGEHRHTTLSGGETGHLFSNPLGLRRELLQLPLAYRQAPIIRGAHFYVHLTGICDVACTHCMYSSDASTSRNGITHLDDEDVEMALRYVADSTPMKLTISGGGEPFLQLRRLLHIVRNAHAPYVEAITAGNWARTGEHAAAVVQQLRDAIDANPAIQEFVLRVSIDRFHVTAPNAVPWEAYSHIVSAWRASGEKMSLGFRGLLIDGDETVERLAKQLGGALREVDSWNKQIELPSGVSLPVTLNVFRFSGKGISYAEAFALKTLPMKTYYAPFEESSRRLVLGRAINDAIKGRYFPVEGLSITLDFDGSLYIFTGTAPDRRAHIRTHSFAESVAWFYRDPITRVLLSDGLYWLCDTVALVDPELVDSTIAINDVCVVVDALLRDDVLRAFATVMAIRELVANKEVQAGADLDVVRFVASAATEHLVAAARLQYRRS